MDPKPDVLPHRLLDRDSGQMLMPLTPVMPVCGGSMEVSGWKSQEAFEMLP